MSQHYPIEEVDLPELTAEDVQNRVDDWLRRLDDLFDQIKTWAKANKWLVEEGESFPMREELMMRYGLSEVQQPSLTLQSPDHLRQIWIRPKGLWVIGANGRVDIYSENGVFTLIDVAEAFKAPQWVLHRIGKGSGKPFDPSLLADMI